MVERRKLISLTEKIKKNLLQYSSQLNLYFVHITKGHTVF